MRVITMKGVVTMVAKIKHHDFVAFAERSPEWEIPVDREAVAVAEHQARTVWFPVLANSDDRAVVHSRLERMTRARHLRMVYLDCFAHSILTGSMSTIRNTRSRSASGAICARMVASAARRGLSSRDFTITCHR